MPRRRCRADAAPRATPHAPILGTAPPPPPPERLPPPPTAHHHPVAAPARATVFEQLEPMLLQLASERFQPRSLQARQQLVPGDRQRLLRRLPAPVRITGRLKRAPAPQPLAHGLAVDPGVFRERDGQLAATLEPPRTQSAAQPRQRRPQQLVTSWWRPVLRPQGRHQLVSAHESLAVQGEEREQHPSLSTRQRTLEPLTVPFDLQATTQVHPHAHRRIVEGAATFGQGLLRRPLRTGSTSGSVSAAGELPFSGSGCRRSLVRRSRGPGCRRRQPGRLRRSAAQPRRCDWRRFDARRCRCRSR